MISSAVCVVPISAAGRAIGRLDVKHPDAIRLRSRTLPGGARERYIVAVTASDVVAALQRRYQTFFATEPAIPFAVAPAAGSAHAFGAGDPAFTITIKDARGAKALAALDQFQVAVAYLQGWLDVDGDLAAALKMRRFFPDFHPIAWLARFAPGAAARPQGARPPVDLARTTTRTPSSS